MNKGKRRSLILAGGGIKVAFQAGALQVWLDEAGLAFDHADGASGGVFNLAMYCQGMSGKEIADNWRNYDPNQGINLNWQGYTRLFFADALFRLDRFRKNVFSTWGLDWDRIRSTTQEATFNAYNFSRHELAVVEPKDMTEDHLVACVSLPMWFPPVEIDGDLYIDAVYITDANMEEAIRRGADELWVIWTVSERSEWHDGFVNNYFQIIETAANGHFKRTLKRIEDSNAGLADGRHSEFGRHIDVKLLKAEVDLHYLLNLSQDRIVEAVNQGVRAARQWCQREGIALPTGQPDYPIDVHEAVTKLQFTEEMKGYVGMGEKDYERGFRKGKDDDTYIMFHLTIKVDGVNRFVTRPDHEATAEGYVRCEAFGGQLPVEKGIFNLFVEESGIEEKRMLYRLFFRDKQGNPLTLSGFKVIKDDPGFDLWSDTTTLFTRILKGHVGPAEEQSAEVLATGIIRIRMMDFFKQLTTFRTEGPSLADRTSAMTRFAKLFLGKLWDVYAREILPESPF